jgi:hypothetical protein
VLEDLKFKQEEATIIYCDNQSTVAMVMNPVFHGRSKHIKIKYHSIREAQEQKEIKLVHCKTDDQLADILTKSLGNAKFETLRHNFGVSSKNV